MFIVKFRKNKFPLSIVVHLLCKGTFEDNKLCIYTILNVLKSLDILLTTLIKQVNCATSNEGEIAVLNFVRSLIRVYMVYNWATISGFESCDK